MIIYSIISVLVGAAAVLQAGFNRVLLDKIGLAKALLINNAVLFLLGIVLYLLVKIKPSLFATAFHIKPTLSLSLFVILPGILGFFIIASMPYLITKIGAVKVFTYLIASQVLVSFAWDFWVEKTPVNFYKILAALMAFLSVMINSLS